MTCSTRTHTGIFKRNNKPHNYPIQTNDSASDTTTSNNQTVAKDEAVISDARNDEPMETTIEGKFTVEVYTAVDDTDLTETDAEKRCVYCNPTDSL